MDIHSMRYETGDPVGVRDAEDPVACESSLVLGGNALPGAGDAAPCDEVDCAITLTGQTRDTPPTRFAMIAQPGVTRARQIAGTLENALADERFRACTARADAARDNGDWMVAAREYRCALALFPLHWGYCIQYGHTVKEQALFEEAEAWYRSAVALGAPCDMVDQHLAYVARLNGVEFVRRGTADLDVAPMRAPPTIHDIRLLGELTRVAGLSGDRPMVDLLRQMPDNRAVFLHMLGMPGFARNNRDLLDIVRGTHA